ncbi:hypothetical protein LH20_11050 [Sphingopyxis sp. 113P3]|nr:hypothetical protein LH20_11050 [Sphingopyxis sp. 113P3]
MNFYPRKVLATNECECGDTMRWVAPKMLRRRAWRQECVCGRCGPWRSAPVTITIPAYPPPPGPPPEPKRD